MKTTIKRIVAGCVAMLAALSLSACGAQKSAELELFAMDTYMSFTAYGERAEDALSEAARTINELEQRLSRTREDSEIWTLNKEGRATVSEDTANLLAQALSCAAQTDGAFDITVAPLVELWGITTDAPRVPSQSEIDALLPLVGSEHLTLTRNDSAIAAVLDPGCSVDLGGIAKGCASDRVADILKEYGVNDAVVSLGGNVYVCGNRPDGAPWRVAIQDPLQNGYAATLTLTDSFVVTSGGYQRFFADPDGSIYQHILDPTTGYPVQSDLLSVTVVCDNGARADAYSTALYVMGEAKAVSSWKAQQKGSSPFEMVLITADERLVCTPGLADSFIQPEDSSYAYEILTP